MKVAHVNYLPTPVYLPGKENKIIAQAKVAYRENLNLDFFILNSELESTENNLYYKKIKFSENKLLKSIQQKLFRYKIIESLVPFKDYDYVVLRYPLAMGFGMKSFYKKWGKIIITEHHTIEERELKTYFQNKILSLTASFIERQYKHHVFRCTRGMIGVTNEIVMHNEKSSDKKTVITNGFDIMSVNQSTRPEYKKTFNIIFIASRFAVWHGLERIIKSAQKYKGPEIINIKLVGKILDSKTNTLLTSFSNSLITFQKIGIKEGKELEEIYSDIHLGISSMGLYNIGLKEACVLKTRDYIARSVPFIYGYQDSDLSGNEVFAYKVSDDAQLIDFNSVINFYVNLIKDDDYQNQMRSFSSNYIDIRIKVNEMWNFVNRVSKMN